MIAKMPKIETEKDELYRLEEMLDEMKKSKDNAENVIKSQMELIDFVKANDTENKFEEFVKAMDEQTISTENAIKTLTTRIEKIEFVVEESKKNMKLSEMLEKPKKETNKQESLFDKEGE